MSEREKKFSPAEKLYLPRDKEGKPNRERLEIIRMFEKEFSTEREFVGIVPYGSTMKGYSDEPSDIDLKILYDSSQSDRPVGLHNFYIEKSTELAQAIKEKQGKVVPQNFFTSEDINPESVLRNMHIKHHLSQQVLVDICKVVTGQKIYPYRELFRNAIQKLTEERQQELLVDIIGHLNFEEERGLEKMMARRPDLSGQKNEILAARRKMWEARVHKVLGIS